jgi:hypothetical protein
VFPIFNLHPASVSICKLAKNEVEDRGYEGAGRGSCG